VRISPRSFAEDEHAAAIASDLATMAAGRTQALAAGGGLSGALLAIRSIVHDGGMYTSEATTRGVRVSVVSEYAPDRSQPAQHQWFFLYTITIANESHETVQLLSRHWIITDSDGHIEEVKGEGVIGQQPVLGPGESFTYTSGCRIRTQFGRMEGTYQMIAAPSGLFDVKIAPFTLGERYTVH
jgi:ApaG protein